jgi:enoyl-CoA hydratase/carnithine racemase
MSDAAPEAVTVSREDGLALVTLSAPPLNLFDEMVFTSLERAIGEIEEDLPRAVLFRAEGRVVSGGVDVNVFDAVESAADGEALFARLLAFARRLEVLPIPTIFAAHGLCLTAAFELALGCDLILAAESAKFGLVERVVGLTPAMGGTQRLVQRAGPGRARELVYTGELFDAATLADWGVVNRVMPDEGFDEAARTFARGIADGPTLAHAATKRIVRAALDGGVEAADAITAENAGGLFATEDLKGAVASFLSDGPGRASFRGK